MLRPLLYRRLCARLGETTVTHENEAFVARMGEYRGRPGLVVSRYGESYRVACPFCGDSGRRLWVNHMWGYRHPLNNSLNLWLALCHNETNCMGNPANRKALYDDVFEDAWTGRRGLADDVVMPGEIVDPDAMPDRVCPPGELFDLHDLNDAHPARRYVKARGYDPDVLSRELGVSYCPEALPQYRLASGRLIIPVVMNGEMVGWQARLIRGASGKGRPKYWTMTGMKTSMTLYNYDNALRSPFVVVTEGPTKVWTFGREAVALLGKSLSGWQAEKLTYWGRELGKPVVVMLDGNAQDYAQAIYDDLKSVPYRVLVPVAPGVDPGDLPTPEIRASVYDHALRQGVHLPGRI